MHRERLERRERVNFFWGAAAILLNFATGKGFARFMGDPLAGRRDGGGPGLGGGEFEFLFEGLEEDFAGAGDAVEHAGAADEEFGHEVVELAGGGDVDAFVVGGVVGEDFVDPGVFVPG